MSVKPTSVAEYLSALPPDRREALQAVREVILANLGPEFEEGIQYGMIGYYLPHSVYPAGYHCDPTQPLPFASLASQKNHMAVYLFCIYTDPAESERFVNDWKKTGKRLDMGKSCVRFKKLDQVALDVVGAAIRRITAAKFLASYEAGRASGKSPARKKAVKKAGMKATAKTSSAPRKKTRSISRKS